MVAPSRRRRAFTLIISIDVPWSLSSGPDQSDAAAHLEWSYFEIINAYLRVSVNSHMPTAVFFAVGLPVLLLPLTTTRPLVVEVPSANT